MDWVEGQRHLGTGLLLTIILVYWHFPLSPSLIMQFVADAASANFCLTNSLYPVPNFLARIGLKAAVR